MAGEYDMGRLGIIADKIEYKINDIRNKRLYKYEQKLKKCSLKAMPKAQFKEIKKFWKQYDKHFKGYEHVQYYKMLGSVNKLFLPDSFFYCYIDYFYNNWNRLKSLDNKCLYDLYFPNVKQPETIAKKINGYWYIDKKIVGFQLVEKELESYSEFVVKIACESAGGNGVKFYRKVDSSFMEFEKNHKDLIIQKTFTQSPILARLNESSINTIRIMTFCKDEKEQIKFLSAVARFGVKGGRTDNASTGGLVVGIDEEGFVKKTIYRLATSEKFTQNPNGGEYEDIKIPRFKDMVKLAIDLHSSFQFARIISWDFAVDDQNDIVLIEANFYYEEVRFHQLCNGPLFKSEEELLQVLNEVTGKKTK